MFVNIVTIYNAFNIVDLFFLQAYELMGRQVVQSGEVLIAKSARRLGDV